RVGPERRMRRRAQHERRIDAVDRDKEITAVAAKLAADDPAGDPGWRLRNLQMLGTDACDPAAAFGERRTEAPERRDDAAVRAGAGQRGDIAEKAGREQGLRPA